MNSDLRANLLDLGFNLSQARAAVAAGNNTVEDAAEWIFAHNDTISQQQGVGNRSLTAANNNSTNTLHLRGNIATDDDDLMDEDLQRALAESTLPQQPPLPPPAAVAAASSSSLLSPTLCNIPSTSQTTGVHASDSQDNDEDSGEPVKKVKINIVRAPQVIAPLPVHSRHNENEKLAQNATRVAAATKISLDAKKLRVEARQARERTLLAAKEDRENIKIRNQASQPLPSPQSHDQPKTEPTADTKPTFAKTSSAALTNAASLSSNAMVQLRLKNGSIIKRGFATTACLKELFDLARFEDKNIGSADISLIQPFPRREFTAVESAMTLAEAGLCPSCSLNVFVQTPIPAPQPITPTSSTPGAWLSPADMPLGAQHPGDIAGDTAMDVDEDEEGLHDNEHHDEDYEPEEDMDEVDEVEEHEEEQEEEEEGEDDDEDEDEEMMHALPIHFHPGGHVIPHAGRGRGRGRGRGGLPFSGAGHSLAGPSLSATSTSVANSSTSTGDTSQEQAPVDANAQRRQRVLEAMENRAKTQALEQEQSQKEASAVSPVKHLKPKDIPSLRSKCAYEVAVMLTRRDAKTGHYLKSLGDNVGSQAAETIVQELIKLKQLDQLSFKRLRACPVVNMVLDGYSRATDSLMDTIGKSQARSLSYLSLKECTFLTDSGFANLVHFDELEYLDMSHCRITDKTLEFTLNIPYLSTLHMSATKVTTGGLAKVIAESAWKLGLHTLDLSYCQGIAGPYVLVNLQELSNLRTLKLNSTKAFDSSPVQVPDSQSFSHLLHVDLARTPITGQDLAALSGTFKSLESLNLTECLKTETAALKHCVEHLSSLQHLNLPNRTHRLGTILPLVARLPLTHLDLTDFIFVGDEAILNLRAATSLQMLSLSGTKLTDVGSAVFTHMSSLRELALDRTDIGDKSMEHLRDLGRIEVLSLRQCRRLTAAGVLTLGRSAFFELKLKRLNLGHNPYVHDEALAAFVQCHGLVALNLEHTDVSEQKALLLQNSLPCLTQLRIQGVTNGAVYEEHPRPTFPPPQQQEQEQEQEQE